LLIPLWLGITYCIVTLLLIVILCARYLLVVVTVALQSMSPTLEHGDRVLVLRRWPKKWLRKGQIVLVTPEHLPTTGQHLFNTTSYIKRIIAVGGEIFTYPANDKINSNIFPQTSVGNYSQQIWHVPRGHVFVSGDNHRASIDSFTWGPLPFNHILGVMLLKLPYKGKNALFFSSSKKFNSVPIGLLTGEDAPMFTAQTLSVEVVTRNTFSGYPVVFVFFAPERHSSKALQICTALAPQLKANGFDMVYVSSTARETTAAFVKKLHIHLQILLAPRSCNSFLYDYKIHMTPAYCAIDAHGKVLSTGLLYPSKSIRDKLTNALIPQDMIN